MLKTKIWICIVDYISYLFTIKKTKSWYPTVFIPSSDLIGYAFSLYVSISRWLTSYTWCAIQNVLYIYSSLGDIWVIQNVLYIWITHHIITFKYRSLISISKEAIRHWPELIQAFQCFQKTNFRFRVRNSSNLYNKINVWHCNLLNLYQVHDSIMS
jgi:hypothetical protein